MSDKAGTPKEKAATAVQQCKLHKVGCIEHRRDVTINVIKLYALASIYLFVKAINSDWNLQREKQNLLKMRQ